MSNATTAVAERQMSYASAVNTALREALEADERVLVFGEDVALPGGVFGVTKGLEKAFGERVFDTPISESAILGGAIGASMFGFRPVVEIMWADFSLVALDQIVNQAANVRYLSRGELSAPLTIRTQQGSAPGACAQHSQSLEVFFAHVPGLQVCMPATPQDAYDLLHLAIASNDPTIVIENRTLYHGLKSEVRLHGPASGQRIGTGAIRREGDDLTVVTWGSMQHRVLEAADAIAEAGSSCEVIDIRWMRPLDIGLIIESVRKTGRLLVVHEAHTFAGLGAEIVAQVVGSSARLAAPPVRIGTPDSRIPAAPSLAEALIPGASGIIRAMRRALDLPDEPNHPQEQR